VQILEDVLSEARNQTPTPQVVSLPRTRRLSWAAMTIETTHQVVLALWTGGVLLTASLVIPSLLAGLDDPEAAARLALSLLDRIGLLGCGAGSFLLLTTLLMHLLTLRNRAVIISQLTLVLVLTAIPTLLQAVVAPRMFDLLRTVPDLFTAPTDAPALREFRRLLGLYLAMLLAQGGLGVALMLGGIRRWYRYVPHRSDPEAGPWT
jgi:hypothetical protein